MEYVVVWSDLTKIQLSEIHAYYLSVASRKTADRLIEGIVLTTKILTNHPRLGQREETLSGYAKGFRYLVKRHYKIVYWIDGFIVVITAVFDCRQDPEKLRLMVND